MPKKLEYFNIGGLAEPIRLILHYTKQDFEDVRHDMDTWPDQKIKESLPYGQLPIYEEDGRVLNQSLAIVKYVARGTDLIPVDPWQQAIVESAVYTMLDYLKNVTQHNTETDPAKKEEMKKVVFNETIDYYFSRFSKQLSENGGYFIGKLTWGEFMLVGMVEVSNLFLNIELEKMYPVVGATVEKIRNLPGVKEYVKARKHFKLPARVTENK